MFGFGGGKLGLMGEAGPEAIMPLGSDGGIRAMTEQGETTMKLMRMSSGHLGVKAFAEGGQFGLSGERALPLAIDANGNPSAPTHMQSTSIDASTSQVTVENSFNVTINGNADNGTVERMRAEMSAMIDAKTPQIVKRSVQAVGREHRDNKGFMQR
jgi:hypothetical protein